MACFLDVHSIKSTGNMQLQAQSIDSSRQYTMLLRQRLAPPLFDNSEDSYIQLKTLSQSPRLTTPPSPITRGIHAVDFWFDGERLSPLLAIKLRFDSWLVHDYLLCKNGFLSLLRSPNSEIVAGWKKTINSDEQ